MTTDFLEWLCEQVQAQDKHMLVLIWDNVSWHVSKRVKTWLRQHNQTVLQETQIGKRGVRIIPCWLPTKSPWLNRIEPKWIHGKRAIVEPAQFLTAQELRQRVCGYFGCELAELLTENGPESPAFSKAGMNGRSFRAGWVEGKHHSSFVLCSPQDEERSSSSLVSRLRAKLLSVRAPDPVSFSST
ncbi:transposase [Ktedonobacter racemifer]|uniref:transposase n=1 Tax=Ktedonobacter racemifer TaxID=363277 RepID=UPI001FCB7742|nr:transposase [Ktedonobacter racemifer]